jgi:hypothetical protein
MQKITHTYAAAKEQAIEWVKKGYKNVNIRGMRGKNITKHIVTARKK